MTTDTATTEQLTVDDTMDGTEPAPARKRRARDLLPDDPARRRDIEAELDEAKVDWMFDPDVPLDEFDDEASLRNQARINPIDDDLVDRYAEAMRRGDEFPALLSYRARNGNLVRMDGNHRFKAAQKEKHEAFPAYVVTDAPPETIKILTFRANAKHGQPPTFEERIAQGVHLMDNGVRQYEAASVTGLTQQQVSKAWAQVSAERRARRMKIKGFERLSATAKARLQSVHNDAAFFALAQLAVDAALGVGDISRLVKLVNSERSEDTQVALIHAEADNLRQRILESAGGVIPQGTRHPRVALLSHLGALEKLDPDAVSNILVDDEERTRIAKRCRALGEQLLSWSDQFGPRS